MPALPLPEGEIHVHYLLDGDITDARLLAAYEALLAPEERARRARYRFEHSRREYLLTRALVRATLSRYARVAPAAWAFRQNEYGRPEIDDPAHASLRFNLSNTRGLVACAVTRDRDVGVDVEDTTRAGETVEIADRFFSPVEHRALRALPADAQRGRFFEYWTLKEAYIKARGMGLAIPLDQFSFLLDDGPTIRIAFDPRLGDDASAWQFAQLALSPEHRTAVAVRRGHGSDLRIVARRTIPLLVP
ncbi:4'-phosphopantetheinyl transferase [Minicystis rosea]|nr:4'-phosphopantetheinyl transferase [Minicystis rosea]